jgi:hypothetical protein
MFIRLDVDPLSSHKVIDAGLDSAHAHFRKSKFDSLGAGRTL